MLTQLDRFYTPEHTARLVLESSSLPDTPSSCADSSCGAGNLLTAASSFFEDIECIGIDRDKRAIEKLKKERPNWILTVGDLLNRKRYDRQFANIIPGDIDLLFLNPPFSHGNKKHIEVTYKGEPLKSSIAMACILRSFELFNPKIGALAIVPESLLFSETDETARKRLSQDYDVRKINELESCTFSGARAHSSVIQILPTSSRRHPKSKLHKYKPLAIQLVRGGLPVHLMKKSSKGIPFIHSTDLGQVTSPSKDLSKLIHTKHLAKGRISGSAVLIPRVGVPDARFVRAIRFPLPVHLSDCVIALMCDTKAQAQELECRIQDSWNSFKDLYRGTGARYVTIARLTSWLESVNIQATI